MQQVRWFQAEFSFQGKIFLRQLMNSIMGMATLVRRQHGPIAKKVLEHLPRSCQGLFKDVPHMHEEEPSDKK
jgi:hypothetical protein